MHTASRLDGDRGGGRVLNDVLVINNPLSAFLESCVTTKGKGHDHSGK